MCVCFPVSWKSLFILLTSLLNLSAWALFPPSQSPGISSQFFSFLVFLKQNTGGCLSLSFVFSKKALRTCERFRTLLEINIVTWDRYLLFHCRFSQTRKSGIHQLGCYQVHCISDWHTRSSDFRSFLLSKNLARQALQRIIFLARTKFWDPQAIN